jgi:diguanylate cyclase (GGDEF)-like protein
LIVILLMLVAILTIWVAWRRQTERVLREAKSDLEAANASLVAEISEREFYEAQLEHQANYDALTSLPNRSLLHERLSYAIDQARRIGHLCAVLFVDLDRFKTVNDSLGHPTGDVLLKAVALRLKQSVRDHDTVARRGGDEFVIVLDNIAHPDIGEVVAKKLLMGLGPSFKVGEFEVFVTCSVGVSIFPRDGDDAETLVKNADIAMYYAKERGRNVIEYYEQYMNARSLERLLLENNLRHAVDRGELVVYYQPQTDLASGRVVGVEALLRWRHPVLGVLLPEDFVPLAEETGLIIPIGRWVLETACSQLKKWQDEGLPILFVAVNLSARQFMQTGLAEIVEQTLRKTNLDPSCLELEITESMIMNDIEGVFATLNVLKSMGVQLAIDDFGTGYASLNYL